MQSSHASASCCSCRTLALLACRLPVRPLQTHSWVVSKHVLLVRCCHLLLVPTKLISIYCLSLPVARYCCAVCCDLHCFWPHHQRQESAGKLRGMLQGSHVLSCSCVDRPCMHGRCQGLSGVIIACVNVTRKPSQPCCDLSLYLIIWSAPAVTLLTQPASPCVNVDTVVVITPCYLC
jgi:hypothetical protein